MSELDNRINVKRQEHKGVERVGQEKLRKLEQMKVNITTVGV